MYMYTGCTCTCSYCNIHMYMYTGCTCTCSSCNIHVYMYVYWLYMYMKIHVSSILAKGANKHTHNKQTNKQLQWLH